MGETRICFVLSRDGVRFGLFSRVPGPGLDPLSVTKRLLFISDLAFGRVFFFLNIHILICEFSLRRRSSETAIIVVYCRTGPRHGNTAIGCTGWASFFLGGSSVNSTSVYVRFQTNLRRRKENYHDFPVLVLRAINYFHGVNNNRMEICTFSIALIF